MANEDQRQPGRSSDRLLATSPNQQLRQPEAIAMPMRSQMDDGISSDRPTITQSNTVDLVIDRPNPERAVSRALGGIQLFMITLNATLGTGLYWRGGQMLELGGALAVVLAFMFVGAVAWAVMQCISEMLCLWPVPGALSVYVSTFVDAELGIAVGAAYWFTYSVSFAALLVATAKEVDFWTHGNDAFNGFLMYLILPCCLILTNAFKVEIYGWIEVACGSVKLAFFAIIMIFLLVINGQNDYGIKNWTDATDFDHQATNSWGTAFLISISIATFAYAGVEIIAASALEARWSRSQRRLENGREIFFIGKTIKFTSIYFSFLAAVAYTLSGLFTSFDISRRDCNLPHLSWIERPWDCDGNDFIRSSSALVIVAVKSRINNLGHMFNAFLVFTAVTCANTNLFVASRTLFGLTARLDGGSGQPWYVRCLAYFGKTDSRKVPMRAVIFSALAFCWVPPLELIGKEKGTVGANEKFIEILAQMGSVGVVIVWAFNCLAFIRYHQCIKKHRMALQLRSIPPVERWDRKDDHPYRSNGQPVLAWLALIGCLFLLLIAGGSNLWDGFHAEPFLSAYLFIFVFFLLWVVLKIVRQANWTPIDLSNPDRVARKLRDLHDRSFEATLVVEPNGGQSNDDLGPT